LDVFPFLIEGISNTHNQQHNANAYHQAKYYLCDNCKYLRGPGPSKPGKHIELAPKIEPNDE
ncbi:unnamed protein product, partial [marine sediment metagenome]